MDLEDNKVKKGGIVIIIILIVQLYFNKDCSFFKFRMINTLPCIHRSTVHIDRKKLINTVGI